MKTSQQRLTQFLIFTFAFSWLIWLPGVLTSFGVIAIPPGLVGLLKLVGAIGPAVAAIYLTGRYEGKPGLKRVLTSSFNVKAHWRFWLGAVAMLLVLHAAARLLYSLVEPNLPQSDLLQSPVAVIPIFIVMFLVGGGLDEEIGWRGYALDLIQEKQTALIASVLLFVVWSVWHFPLFFMGGTNQSLIPIWLWLLPVLPLAVMLTWVYNNTHTIFAAAMFHTVGNFAHELIPGFSHRGQSQHNGPCNFDRSILSGGHSDCGCIRRQNITPCAQIGVLPLDFFGMVPYSVINE